MKPKMLYAVHPQGWLVTFDIGSADPKLNKLISQLEKLGFQPHSTNLHICHLPDKVLPVCPKHNHIMAKRENQGDVWFSHPIIDPVTGEKHYCRGFETKYGSGWYVDAPVAA